MKAVASNRQAAGQWSHQTAAVRVPTATRPCRRQLACPLQAARGNKAGASASDASKDVKDLGITLWPTQFVAPRVAYTAVEYAVLVGSLALVDAGWSGDWSRIGVISVEQEALARSIITVAASAHSVTALICVWLAQQGGYSLPLAAFKGFAYGSLGIIEIHSDLQNAKA